MSKQASRRVCIGRITRPHGLRGEVRAWVDVDDLETLQALEWLELDDRPYQVLAVRVQNNAFLLSLAGVTTREQAQELAGREIWIDPTQLPPLPPGEYYHFEIIGLPVYVAETLAYVGEVAAILTTPAHDVYVIQGQGQEYLIPAVAQTIKSIDPQSRRLVIAAAGLATANGAH